MSARKPAGAPEDWEERGAAGAPADEQRPNGDQPVEEAGPSEDAAGEVERDFDQLLSDVTRQRDEYLELAQRARADFENYRKRAARDSEDAERRGKAGIARELVPALDNLERALRSAGVDLDPGSGRPASDDGTAPQSEEVSAHEALARGVALVFGELLGTLERNGVERYDPTGERFDPAWHEALQTRSAEDAGPGVVLETIEKGYRLDGQLIRAARVVVSE
jgi:molecular chaperone GrpE